MLDLLSLNANQLESVNWNEGPLLVLAGPGSGKTRVLTYRIARLIEESAGKHFRILGLTFTNKAAAEMRKRIEALVPNAGERTLLTTFHSFSVGLLRQHGSHIGLRPDFTILSQSADREAVLNEAIGRARKEQFELSYSGQQLLPLITWLLDNCVGVDDADGTLQAHEVASVEGIAACYRNYRNLMIENSHLDFGCLIAETLNLLDNTPAVRKQVNRIYTYVCVDEFQDTNLAQYRLLCNIVNPAITNLFVVADENQIIYQWNGANPERLRSLRRDFEMSVLRLPRNYRCPRVVIEAANKLIAHNSSFDSEKSVQVAHKQSDKGNRIRVKNFRSFLDEADWVATDIALRAKDESYNCVVLARTRRLLSEVLKALKSRGVPGYLAMRKDEFVSKPMVWLHAMLRLANARQDREQLRRVCNSFNDLVDIELIVGDIISDSVAADGDYLRAWFRVVMRLENLDCRTRKFLDEAVSKLADRLDFRSFVKLSFEWLDNLSDNGSETDDKSSEYQEERDTWRGLENEVNSELAWDRVTLNVLLQGLDLRSKTPNPRTGAVPCFTIHVAKGMEFDHVYLVGLVEDQLPSWSAVKKGADSHEMQEERRNCFVAVTRTQESLTLTYSREVFGWTKRPSRFLKEMELV